MKINILLAFILCSQLALAQETINPVGYVFDHNMTEISGYADLDYEQLNGVSIMATATDKYLPGSYTDRTGKTFTGFIRQISLNNMIYFNETGSEFDKKKKLKAKSIKSYTVGVDSFFSKDNFKIKLKGDKEREVESGFLSTVLDHGDFKIHKYFDGQYTEPTYIMEEDGEFTPVSKDRETFEEEMPYFFEDDKVLSEKIASGEYGLNKITTIISEYDVHYKMVNEDRIYYDQYWNEIDEREGANFYAKVVANLDSSWAMDYYDMQDTKIVSGQFSSFAPQKKHGPFVWYYPNGSKRKEGKFKDNEAIGHTFEYHENGKLHREYVHKYGKRKYLKVYDSLGNKLFNSDGLEAFYDPYLKREIHRKYADSTLVESYFIDKEGRKIYQKTSDRNAGFKGKGVSKVVIKYPRESIINEVRGTALVSLIITPSGDVESVNILRGLDNEIDKKVVYFFSNLKSGFVRMKSGKSGKEKVFQEIVVPVSFSISSRYEVRPYFNDGFWFHQQQMFHWQNQPLNVTPPSFPR